MDRITKTTIIETAEQLIKETGKSEVSVPQIARKLGITHAAIYKYFDNKQELWEAVAQKWFNEHIFDSIVIDKSINNRKKQLHDWIWKFVNAKKDAYLHNQQMFKLNTKYIDNDPYALRKVLMSSYDQVNQIMHYDRETIVKAETIMAAFSVFTLPNFSEFWQDTAYQSRFEAMWNLIETGL